MVELTLQVDKGDNGPEPRGSWLELELHGCLGAWRGRSRLLRV